MCSFISRVKFSVAEPSRSPSELSPSEIIGKAENIYGLEALGAHWHYNTTAWMTYTICKE